MKDVAEPEVEQRKSGEPKQRVVTAYQQVPENLPVLIGQFDFV